LPVEQRRAFLVAKMGHRAGLDYELSELRYSDDPSALDRMVDSHLIGSHKPQQSRTSKLEKSLTNAVAIARRFQALKEDAKHHSLRELALLRRAVMALDQRLQLGGLSWFLSVPELLDLRDQRRPDLIDRAARRKEERARLLELKPLSPTLTALDIETISAGQHALHHDSDGLIRGTRVSGSGVVEGRARVISDADAERGNPIPAFQDGDVIVSSIVHPSWLPYFPRAGGFISEVGGWLSHTAILAREYDVPMIVNTEGISLIPDGSSLRLHVDGSIDLLLDERQPEHGALEVV